MMVSHATSKALLHIGRGKGGLLLPDDIQAEVSKGGLERIGDGVALKQLSKPVCRRCDETGYLPRTVHLVVAVSSASLSSGCWREAAPGRTRLRNRPSSSNSNRRSIASANSVSICAGEKSGSRRVRMSSLLRGRARNSCKAMPARPIWCLDISPKRVSMMTDLLSSPKHSCGGCEPPYH